MIDTTQSEAGFQHETVLLHEAVNALDIKPDGNYVDATFGRGGHSQKILEQLSDKGRLLIIDKDLEAIAYATQLAVQDKRIIPWKGSFGDIQQALESAEMREGVDGLLMDLGVSSPQIDNASRGFSFQRDGQLDMRMSTDVGETAREWLHRASAEEIAKVLWEYGEERFSRRIARFIVNHRETEPLETTLQLADLVKSAVPGKKEVGKHPATRSFQAIRIYINQELEDLKRCLDSVPECLKPGGRLVVISFHSLEDRIVKRYIKSQSVLPVPPRGLPVTIDPSCLTLKKIGKPIKPAKNEVQNNVRARSAIMRIGERL